MNVSIPLDMQKYFFDMYPKLGRLNERATLKVLQFIALTDAGQVSENARAMFNGVVSPTVNRVNQLMREFFANKTTWCTNLNEGQPFGYQVHTDVTLIEWDKQEIEVWELYGSTLNGSRTRETAVREWFDTFSPAGLLQAIECRVAIPRTMYTGLDDFGSDCGEIK